MSNNSAARDIYTVSRLNQEVARVLLTSFPLIWLEGELSNVARPRSGHMYFSVKDASSQLRAAMFRNNNIHLRFKPEDGMQVLMRARVALYEPRGDYQLIVEHMEEAGDGALRRAYEELKHKLHNEGLFSEERKKPLPSFPQRLGIITSASGAAIRDVLSVLRRRYPLLPIIIYPVAVQGSEAVPAMIQAIKIAQQRAECDILLITRGGGSLEDLQAFNNEQLARTIANCKIPVVSGVGHEIDFTITDFVADLRAATPSAAAELISPDINQLAQKILSYYSALSRNMLLQLEQKQTRIITLSNHLQRLHPQQRLNTQSQQLDALESRLQRSIRALLEKKQTSVTRLNLNLNSSNPNILIQHYKTTVKYIQQRLYQASQQLLQQKKQRISALMQNLSVVSPLATLQRGYAIVTPIVGGHPIVDAAKVNTGELLDVRLDKGQLTVRVDKK